jgi:uncharacterized protein YdgA (DUF945 family)
MKKPLIALGIVVAVAILALLALPYALGIKIEENFRGRLTTMAAKGGLQVAGERFERGWFSSTAETVLRLPGVPVEVSAQHTIHHGPVRFDRWLAGDFQIQHAQIETEANVKITGQRSSVTFPFSTSTTIALNGDGHMQIRSPAKRIAEESFEWQGINGEVRFDTAMQHIRSTLNAPRLSVGVVEIADMKLTSDMREGIAGHYLGNAAFQIGSIDVTPAFQAKKLGITTSKAAHGTDITFGITYEVLDIRTPTGQFGPGKLAIEIRKLDAATLARFQEEMNALQRSDRPREQIGMMQMGKVMQLVGELAKKAPEMEITELRFRMGGEEISGKAKLVLDGSKADLTQNPLLILTALAGDFELKLPGALLKPLVLPMLTADLENYRRKGQLSAQTMTPEQTAAVLDRALPLYLSRHPFARHFVQDNDRYRLNATLRRGQILVNGEPLSMPGASLLPALR